MLNRREVLKAGAAAALSSLVPTWLLAKPEIDLAAFCDGDPHGFKRLYMAEPFVQATGDVLHKYATDAKIAIRVDAGWSDAGTQIENLAPANRLCWGAGKNWQRWPKQNHLVASDTECPECDGEGFVIADGHAGKCPKCKGFGCGAFPGIQMVGGTPIEWAYDTKLRRHLRDIEYAEVTIAHPHGSGSVNGISIRFDGGLGLLAGLDPIRSKARIAAWENS